MRLAELPTPLDEAARLRAALGGPEHCPRILIKRDDLAGGVFGGNKVRKLEFVIADALNEGATVLVTTGAVQSNHARLTAACAQRAGLKAALVLTTRAGEATPALQGNLLLTRLLGADVTFVDDDPGGPIETARVDAVIADLARRGEHPYLVTLGASDAIGALGYVSATLELLGQLQSRGVAPSRLYYASGSRGTQAGLALGAALYAAPYALHGIAISPGEPDKTPRAIRIATGAAMLLGTSVPLAPSSLETDQRYIGEGYAIPTTECQEAIRLLAETEALVVDPVYTGKALAALIDHVRQREIPPSETVVFLHTGGVASLFGHVPQLGLDASAVCGSP